ncbi:hypothetical protein [Parvularcula sp. LCG005]|uniref:hypothetical protein n=1 Tax=Parvularcula sp. LCG005 TaxID=3078805 RepID=UPI002942D344|nr:hypothetical protein [Parvularcula sp. LCG005]WOI52306.1 hypothetical protein RUI03_09085 [Parvularcula sp. LCG005]
MLKSMLAGATASLALLTASSYAIPLTLDSDWQYFAFEGEGSSFSTTFEFTLTETAYLAVTDAYLAGDQFEIFLNGDSIGLTSVPLGFEDEIDDDFDFAFGSMLWSSAEIALSPGTYVLSGLAALSPFDGGGAALQLSSTALGGPAFITSEVPIPAAAVLFGTALIAGSATRIRRRKT